jgi:protein TonB
VITTSVEAPTPAQPPLARRAPPNRFGGRTVYTVALQMANVTSSSGSWILWYADRAQAGSDAREILAPVPLHKVDPIYDLSAAADMIEGKVQLSAVIHSDGYVYNIAVVSGLDPRLDQNAVAALRKWEFQPARREGAPVDVDVVIEIPFRLRILK